MNIINIIELEPGSGPYTHQCSMFGEIWDVESYSDGTFGKEVVRDNKSIVSAIGSLELRLHNNQSIKLILSGIRFNIIKFEKKVPINITLKMCHVICGSISVTDREGINDIEDEYLKRHYPHSSVKELLKMLSDAFPDVVAMYHFDLS